MPPNRSRPAEARKLETSPQPRPSPSPKLRRPLLGPVVNPGLRLRERLGDKARRHLPSPRNCVGAHDMVCVDPSEEHSSKIRLSHNQNVVQQPMANNPRSGYPRHVEPISAEDWSLLTFIYPGFDCGCWASLDMTHGQCVVCFLRRHGQNGQQQPAKQISFCEAQSKPGAKNILCVSVYRFLRTPNMVSLVLLVSCCHQKETGTNSKDKKPTLRLINIPGPQTTMSGTYHIFSGYPRWSSRIHRTF